MRDGKCEANGSAFAGHAANRNVSSVAAHIGLADTESQAGAFTVFGGKEGLEDVRQNVCRALRSLYR